MQTLLVHWALDGHMRKSTIGQTWRADSRVEFRIGRHLSNRTDALRKTSYDDLGEKLHTWLVSSCPSAE